MEKEPQPHQFLGNLFVPFSLFLFLSHPRYPRYAMLCYARKITRLCRKKEKNYAMRKEKTRGYANYDTHVIHH